MKKTISILLITVMMLLNCAIISANTNGSMDNFKPVNTYKEGQFIDVKKSDWYAENVKMAYELSLVTGTTDTTFSPDSNLTIAEAITLACRLHNIYYGSTYTFVPGDVWYQTYVDYAISNGIIYSDSYRNFDAYATRSQFAQIFASAIPDDALQVINHIADNSIPDVNMESKYSASVYKLYRAGILTGNDAKGTFAPNTNIQRSAVAAIVSRMANEGLRQKITLKNTDINKVLTSEEIYSQCSPAVFYIEVYDNYGYATGNGSGFFIESSGVAITNYHVIENACSAVITMPRSQATFDVTGVYSYSKEQDWAIIQVSGNNFPKLDIGSDDSVHIGQKIYAIGSPLGIQNTISEGLLSNKIIISGVLVEYHISAPISPGSSGGALLTEKGQVIGITSGQYTYGQNLNYVVPMQHIPLNFNRANCKTLKEVMFENGVLTPPENIRVVKQADNTAYLQWDEVPGADYYYLYYQENGENTFWYETYPDTDEKVRITYDEKYSAKLYDLEYGKIYNVIVTSVKNGIESQDSEIMSFKFISGNNMDILRQGIITNCTYYEDDYYELKGLPFKYEDINILTSLVYNAKANDIYIDCTAEFNNRDKMNCRVYINDERKMADIRYKYKSSYGTSTSGMAEINPLTFDEYTMVDFYYYDSGISNATRFEHEDSCALLAFIAISEANYIFDLYNFPLTMSDFRFLNF